MENRLHQVNRVQENDNQGNRHSRELNFAKTGFGKMAIWGILFGILTCNPDFQLKIYASGSNFCHNQSSGTVSRRLAFLLYLPTKEFQTFWNRYTFNQCSQHLIFSEMEKLPSKGVFKTDFREGHNEKKIQQSGANCIFFPKKPIFSIKMTFF